MNRSTDRLRNAMRTACAVALLGLHCRTPEESTPGPTAERPSPEQVHAPAPVDPRARWCQSLLAMRFELFERYPFRRGSTDADIDRFRDWLDPHTGEFWQFLRSELSHSLQFEGETVVLVDRGANDAKVHRHAREFIEELWKLTQSLHTPGQPFPSLSSPVRFEGPTAEIALSIDANAGRLNGLIPWPVTWPGRGPERWSSISKSTFGFASPQRIREAGDWAIFRLIEHGSWKPTPRGIQLTWDFDNHRIGLAHVVFYKDHPEGRKGFVLDDDTLVLHRFRAKALVGGYLPGLFAGDMWCQ